jgi:Arc/MetJ family transcription regulator
MDKIGVGKNIKKANRNKARQAVMDEQELQDQEGMIDDSLLAEIYTATTIASRKKAHNEAMAVREEVDTFGGKEDNAEKDIQE